MSIFGFYFVSTLLRETGWPKKQGIFKKEVIDTTILDSTIDQMVDWAAALGAGRPNLALQIIAEMFRDRDWEGSDAPSIEHFISGMRSSNESWTTSSGRAPHDIIVPTKFSKTGASMPAKALNDVRSGLEHFVLEGILWGLANPDAFENWFVARHREQTNQLPMMSEAGLEIGALPDLQEFLANSEQILRGYEAEIGPLQPIPAKLIADASKIGRSI